MNKYVTNASGAQFVTHESIPIGLEGQGQRPVHTNLVGRIIAGCFTAGEAVSVPLTDGTVRSAQLIGITLPYDWAKAHNASVFPESMTADTARDITLALSVRIPPEDARLVLTEPAKPIP